MNFKELLEGAEPKMPGAPSGIKIMTPQQFVASAGDSKADDEVSEGPSEVMGLANFAMGGGIPGGESPSDIVEFAPYDHNDSDDDFDGEEDDEELRSLYDTKAELEAELDYAEDDEEREQLESDLEDVHARIQQIKPDAILEQGVAEGVDIGQEWMSDTEVDQYVPQQLQQQWRDLLGYDRNGNPSALWSNLTGGYEPDVNDPQHRALMVKVANKWFAAKKIPNVKFFNVKDADDELEWLVQIGEQGVAEGQEHLDRIRKLSGLDEATKLPASSRDLKGQEFQDYMKRIVGTPDVDKQGNVKVDKKGNEKFVSGKTKGDKYKMPYIHRSSVVTYLSPDGKTYDEDAVKKTLAIRPKALLKQNEKMKHSNGEFEQFFNVGFAALVGIALDEQTNNLIVVNTCPGAGSCKVDCFAMKGGKIQFKAAWQSDGRILTYLLNDPDGFFNQLSSEISKEASAAAKGDKKFPNGWQTTVRWHDAGDFFSPEYLDMALKMAAKHPDVRFYAYTKMAGAALAKKPDNFIINWSEGANTEQEKQVKAQDPNLDKTKNSRIVPEKLFWDLLAKDEKGNLDKEGADEKGKGGRWVTRDNQATQELKQRLAKEYGLSSNSILNYDEYMAKRNSIPAGMKYNVIVAPGEGDVSANDPGVLSTLLLRH